MSAPAGSASTALKPDRLGYWYLRLNGFLLLENLLVHPEHGPHLRTDADLIGVRFAHRSENFARPMEDDPRVAKCNTLLNVVIVEVKKSRCEFNGPWTDQEKKNVQRVLRALGCFHESEIVQAAKDLYEKGRTHTTHCTCWLLAFGDQVGDIAIPDVRQILFNETITFILGRFRSYQQQKRNLDTWPEDGQRLGELARNGSESARSVRQYFGLDGLGETQV